MFYIVQKSKTNEDDSLYKSEVVHVDEDERFNHFHGYASYGMFLI